MNVELNTPQPTSARSGQFKLLAILAVVALPILAAWIMARFEVGIPTERNNRSELVEPVITLDDWGVILEPIGYGSPWRLAVTLTGDCDERCLTLVHEARQINVALGREAGRVEHLMLTARTLEPEMATRLAQEYPRLGVGTLDASGYRTSLREHPTGWSEGPQLWLIDPLGRVVLHQDPDQPGKRLLDDLKHLLKVSKVG
ncbi:hypothetical protein [Pseudomonas sp.]|uniref:hypothetical protein n=1 Tax=Pseudomonas sp. TaxID=306 RepID=UPI002729D8D9|nr:hypothetical protein [Pseudomonas sp.]